MSLHPLDMDGDGDDDILASIRRDPNRGVVWLENVGAEAPDWALHFLGGQATEVMFLDAKSPSDIFAAIKPHEVLHLNGEGRNRTSRSILLAETIGTGKSAAVGDIDRDGRDDLVVSCENADGEKSGVVWLRATDDNPRQWVMKDISGPAGVKFDRIELLDLDSDGDLDVLTCEERDNLGVIWYENPLGVKPTP